MDSTKKNAFTNMPSAFDESKIVTDKMWTISLVKRHNKHWWNLHDRFFPSQHANIIIQSIHNGEVGVTKLHVTKTKKVHPKDEENSREGRTPDERLPKDTKKSLHIQIITNIHYKINIADTTSLHNAIKRVMGIKKDKFHKFQIEQDWDHLTWLVKAESAIALIKKVEAQEVEFAKTHPSYWWFGDKSNVHLAIRGTKIFIDENKPLKATVAGAALTGAYISGAVIGAGGLALGVAVISKSTITNVLLTTLRQRASAFGAKIFKSFVSLSTFIIKPSSMQTMLTNTIQTVAPKALPYLESMLAPSVIQTTVIAAPVLYFDDPKNTLQGLWLLFCGANTAMLTNIHFPQIAGMEEFSDKNIGHSCFTWARKQLLELGEEIINNDPNLRESEFDSWISMTSQHIPSNEYKLEKY